ncbi:hypothetical protein QBC40DRAFT_315569 [Triangularia verruculosa]|uniref:Uncharacterized protein n=1 Tax=Triangularia verruculosa TaxID=2587418 RepID=A0AAN6X7S5_9PEZI|nr:hypothetical protein QBC40DRAFT_315569 [Triangularia verruculosa]
MKIMWFSLATFASAILAMPTAEGKLETNDVGLNATAAVEAALLACGCVHNNDAGRWDDPMSPSGRVADLCSRGGGCHQAAIGRMCVHGDLGQCGCAVQSAQEWESFSGPAFNAVVFLSPSLANWPKT